jgi:hypothetical protein
MIDDRYPSIRMDDYVGTEALDWALEGNKILTNLNSPLKIRYIAIIEDPTKWDINFREALACRIAAELAEDLTQSNQKRQLAWQEYDRAIGIALRCLQTISGLSGESKCQRPHHYAQPLTLESYLRSWMAALTSRSMRTASEN